MFDDVEFTIELGTIVSNAVTIVAILAFALVLRSVLNRILHRAITLRIPKLRQESQDQLALRSETLSMAASRLVSFVVWLPAALMIASELGVDTGPLLVSVGLASLAIGLAAQNIIRDFLNGFFILAEDWYRVGEVAVVAGIGGLVEDITLRRTVLRDLDGAMHSIPNSQINFSTNLTRDWSRINLNVPVAYGEDLDHVIRVIEEVCHELKDDPVLGPDLLSTPHVERVDDFAESAIEIKVLGETKPIRQWALTGELRKRLKARFDREGIEIPVPHTKVYFGDEVRSHLPDPRGGAGRS